MKILFFAQAQLAAGCGEGELAVDRALSIPEFWQQLRKVFPDIGPFEKTARLARGEAYLAPGAMLQPGDEIAVIPPVSGG